MRWRTRTNGRTERGASAVEFALVMPILILVLIGIVNFGFVLAQQISLNNAARQAARYAVVDGRTCLDIKNEGKNAAETIGMSVSAGTVPTPVITNCTSDTAKPCAGTAPNTNITVTMTRSGTADTWAITAPPFNLITVPTVRGTGVMRCEFS
ncbi:hypothetical protein GCM10011376_18760 [Nocardioides flavus (ex Wang et al. 2016)]|uniref:TadE-like domain-containing protein n=1 Tax=Nocardioides flavus (ex Wang et al. 2016) TaxID=2058780 RepID=A0ABQ3HKN7_9ACTN|nr:TadE/TadG family type IV pilus assembly protein [Nocardioides flavus (ex Wang et al. 2016)]GHE17266.1 hypothetical protein GCM10011376_18760 [Nocardioides flavus (ex Wang et al. 2016)]